MDNDIEAELEAIGAENGQLTPQKLISNLHTYVQNEKLSPDLLPHHDDEVEQLTELLKEQRLKIKSVDKRVRIPKARHT